MTRPSPAPSGAQYVIRHGDQRAVITEIGAMVREYQVGDREVFIPFGVDEVCPVFNAAVLLPWPNRLEDGAYQFAGVKYQLPLSEPARNNAIHGLAAWLPWRLLDHTPSACTLELALPAQRGWPFQIVATITYRLDAEGLSVELTTQNIGQRAAPYGVGFHPWLSTGGANLDECTVRLDATERITTDERLLPTGREPVQGPFDLRTERSLAGLDLDDAFVGVTRDAQGRSWCLLGCPDGRTPAVWMDQTMDVWQVCSANHIAAHLRFGLAAEPMTCPANAFNTGDRLINLAPGQRHTVRWGAMLR